MTEETQVELKIYGRISYPSLHKPKEGKNDKGQPTFNFCTHVIFAEDDHPGFTLPPGVHYGAGAIQAVKDAQRKVVQAGWPNGWQDVLAELAHKDRVVLKDGTLGKPGQEEYKGKYFVSTNGKKRPTLVITRNGKNEPLVETDGKPYGGCWAIVHMAIYPQGTPSKPSDFGKRVNAQLMGVHFVKDGEAFGGGGRVSAPEEFGVINAEADAPAPAAAAGGRSLF